MTRALIAEWRINRERTALLAIWVLAVLGWLLGLVFAPVADTHPDAFQQVLALIRTVTTAALSVVLIFGPGVAIRARHPDRLRQIGFLALPGLAVLTVTACVAWILARSVDPRAVCTVLLAPVVTWLFVSVWRAGDTQIFTSDERRVLAIVAAVLGVAVARSLWSLGPTGELLGGTTFRTLEVSERSDSAIPFRIVQLIAHGQSPYGATAHSYFGGFTFSDRGPISGLASAPIVFLSGGHPPAASSGGPWSPFDAQGFMSYRLAMMTLASTAFTALWTLARQLGGVRIARFALLLAATTPFLVHEVWFTWPKLLAATLVLLSATSLLQNRPFSAGLLLGIGYLVHPLALFSLPALVFVAVVPPTCHSGRDRPAVASWRQPPTMSVSTPIPTQSWAVVRLMAGLAIFLIGWRLVNGAHYTQTSFLHYLTASGSKNLFLAEVARAHGGHPPPPSLSAWSSDRLISLANTLLPFRVLLLSSQDLNGTCGLGCTLHTSIVVKFFLQYWVALPFAMGIAFLPLWTASLWRATTRWPWVIAGTVFVPFACFLVYWGGASTGLLREGLQPWVLTLLIVAALEQGHSSRPWLARTGTRVLLVVRALEVLLLAMLPTLATRHHLIASQFAVTDLVAVIAMVALVGWLGVSVWHEPLPTDRAATRPVGAY